MPPPKFAGWLARTLRTRCCWTLDPRCESRKPSTAVRTHWCLSCPSSTLLAFAPKISLSAYNSQFSSFSQPCPLRYLLALPAILYCTKKIPLCSSFAPQKDTFFPCFVVVEHGSPQWQSCTYPQHIPPWLLALSHFFFSLHFP